MRKILVFFICCIICFCYGCTKKGSDANKSRNEVVVNSSNNQNNNYFDYSLAANAVLLVLFVVTIRSVIKSNKEKKMLKDEINKLKNDANPKSAHGNKLKNDQLKCENNTLKCENNTLKCENNTLKEKIKEQEALINDSKKLEAKDTSEYSKKKPSDVYSSKDENVIAETSQDKREFESQEKEDKQNFLCSENKSSNKYDDEFTEDKQVDIPCKVVFFGNVKGNFFNDEFDSLRDEAKFEAKIQGDKGTFLPISVNRISSCDNIGTAVKYKGEISISVANDFTVESEGKIQKNDNVWDITDPAIIKLI